MSNSDALSVSALLNAETLSRQVRTNTIDMLIKNKIRFNIILLNTIKSQFVEN